MKYLIDSREPITTEDIDRAIDDARDYLDGYSGDAYSLVERLAAIVEHAYGRPGRDGD